MAPSNRNWAACTAAAHTQPSSPPRPRCGWYRSCCCYTSMHAAHTTSCTRGAGATHTPTLAFDASSAFRGAELAIMVSPLPMYQQSTSMAPDMYVGVRVCACVCGVCLFSDAGGTPRTQKTTPCIRCTPIWCNTIHARLLLLPDARQRNQYSGSGLLARLAVTAQAVGTGTVSNAHADRMRR